MRRVYNSIFLAVALYSFAAWAYVAATALAQPQTLSWQLTHLARWPRTDTFGELCFVLSFVAFIAYRLTREQPPREPPHPQPDRRTEEADHDTFPDVRPSPRAPIERHRHEERPGHR